MTDEEIREHLRLKYLPTAEGFDVCAVETYEHFLALTRSEQDLYMQTLSDGEYELFVELVTSRAVYNDPMARYPGSIDQAKVDAHPERYSWWSKE
jgi:hypothetical protein